MWEAGKSATALRRVEQEILNVLGCDDLVGGRGIGFHKCRRTFCMRLIGVPFELERLYLAVFFLDIVNFLLLLRTPEP